MKTLNIFAICLAIIFNFQTVFGQEKSRPPGYPPTDENVTNRDYSVRHNILAMPKPTKEQIEIAENERKRFLEATSVSKEDLAKYKDFLEESKTGIFRLMPDFDCSAKKLVKVDDDCANYIFGTTEYSFRKEQYVGNGLQDIVFKKNYLITSGYMSQGILVSLGDISLNNISLSSDGLKFLVDFEPGKTREAVYQQYTNLKNGIKNTNFTYSNHTEAKEYTTYAMRIIAYEIKDKLRKRRQRAKEYEYSFNLDKRKDLILVFRIIRKSEDGGITILWKELQRQKSPKLVFQKDEKLEDFRPAPKKQ